MNISILMSTTLVVSAFLCGQGLLVFAQPHPAADETVQRLAEMTVNAMRNGNAGFLAKLVDPSGIVVGVDMPRMSAKRFRRELIAKRGVYCVIFDRTCLQPELRKSPTTFSLREALVEQPVRIQLGSVQDAPEIATAEVKRANTQETLFTLYFRHVEHHWTLQNIEYW
jgi:hypothetical protein